MTERRMVGRSSGLDVAEEGFDLTPHRLGLPLKNGTTSDRSSTGFCVIVGRKARFVWAQGAARPAAGYLRSGEYAAHACRARPNLFGDPTCKQEPGMNAGVLQ